MTANNFPKMLSPKIGLGCMNLSHAYGKPVAEEEAIKSLNAALDMGYQHFDTATLYGAGKNELLVGKALMHRRSEFFLASKCGMSMEDGKKLINGRPEHLKKQCEASLKRLGTDHIDLYYLHRKDPDVPIEESTGALADLVKEGKIGAIGLSEVSAQTLRQAHNEHPITALQSEYSLWTRNPEIATLKACEDLNVTFVAFSPLARGFLSGAIKSQDDLIQGDIRNNMPRFDAQHYPKNLALLGRFTDIASNIGCTPAQLALSWVLHQSKNIVAIPGTRFVSHMEENLASHEHQLEQSTIALLDELINQNTVSGPRYNQAQQHEIDTEEFI
ncbi:aldo/keto reductase [Marinomonas mediterranea]|jgi:Predicted oxidoreductases (related to aryl-alcohol dehydrogenases)|uniref:Pyridoxine 4-dehydrogenase n=1 Tax=Marinomonas mediterranea (strain ATCC 700492 / JCM 21426 / NBRC 103028 / MMB-1) TaxID=717774 RepID=F2K363_MARM1|nr:aldo/keto reductase [Marinomonas mediterranea]ADZ90116.1 Pyridoxine 4-dehydrogenase [Marinomonas mediterranea MMB-1]WCN16322.1 aldo/keto reductase [Marinomonas mediterranea MMB-1]